MPAAESPSTDRSYSENGGLNWTLALFPFGYKRHHFRFVSTESDIMLAGVREVNAPASQDYGALYMSANGQETGRFVLSLRHVKYSSPSWHEASMFAGHLQLERSAGASLRLATLDFCRR